jgi:hypothetical protein
MEKEKDKQAFTVCLNCHQEFYNQFEHCPHCGQQNKPLTLSFRYFLHDFISGSFNIDSKIFRTLKLLITRPGLLPKEFLAGKRTKYIPPVRLYLIISLVYFSLLSLINAEVVDIKDTGDAVADSTEIDTQNISAAPPVISGDSLRRDTVRSSEEIKKDVIITMDNPEDLVQFFDEENDSVGTTGEKEESALRKISRDRLKKLATDEGKENFQALMRKYISIGMFVLMPITALLFFALFYKDTFYIQHLVFVLYLQSLMYLLFIVLNLFGFLYDGNIMILINVFLFMYILVIWVKRFYETRWWTSVWKSLLFLLMYGVSFFIFMGVVAAISAFNL